MDFSARTDLACESMGELPKSLKGVRYRCDTLASFQISRLTIESEEAAAALGRPIGHYVTVACGKIHLLSKQDLRFLAHLLSGELRGMAERLSGKRPNNRFGIFAAGLGNAELTADAIGPQTVRQLNATRHLAEQEAALYQRIGCSALSALAPGVLGQTGIETSELLRGAVACVKPDVMVAVDALAARSCARLAATVQLSDAGITPGSGVGNHRAALTRETMGIPVIAVGVPTVVDSATLVYDALQQAGITEIDPALEGVLENRRGFFVSPKESDVITSAVSRLLAEAIGLAFTPELMEGGPEE